MTPTATRGRRPTAAAQVAGRHRRSGGWAGRGLVGLAVAVAAGAALLTLSPPGGDRPRSVASPAPPRLSQAWPAARPADTPGQLADGSTYSPWLYLDAQTSVGTAATPDRTAIRVVLVRAGGAVAGELHRVPATENPQFAGFTADGETLVWAESTASAQARSQTRLWRAAWRTAAPATLLTADTGDIVLFSSQHDLVLADGRVHWAAAARTAEPVTETRSVPLAGGAVAVRTVPGAFAHTGWPWLVSAGSGQAGPVELVNLASGERRKVAASGTELVTCSPEWCRVLVLSATGGAARIDLMRPDGSQRRRVAGSSASAAVIDIGVAGRFEVLSVGNGATATQQLLLYDARDDRLVLVAGTVGTVQSRGGLLWWSTGDDEALVWHALDLRNL